MNLLTEDSFDFKKSHYNKEEYIKKLKYKTFYILIGAVISLSVGLFVTEIQKTEEQIKTQELETLHNDYIKNLTQNADLIYNGKNSMVPDYIKLGNAIKEQNEESILMYYTLLKARTDINSMAYMSHFDLEVFSNHSIIIGKKLNIILMDNDPSTKIYRLSDNLIGKMKTVYLSRKYPDKLAFNYNCNDNIEFCYYSKQAGTIIKNDIVNNYANNYKKLQEIMK